MQERDSKWGGSDQRARADSGTKTSSSRGAYDWGNGGRTRGSSGTTSGGNGRTQTNSRSSSLGGNGGTSTSSPVQMTPQPPVVTITQNTPASSSTGLNNSATGVPVYKSPFRGQLPISSTSRFTASVRYTTDPSGSTDTISIGVPPDGTSSTLSTKSGGNAGVIAGAVIFILFLLVIMGFLLRRRIRRKNRIAPSAQYLSEYGSRPLSQWGRAFSRRRRSSRHYDRQMKSIWRGTNSQFGHSHTPENHSLAEQATQAHMDVLELRESQSQAGPNVRGSPSISGKTSIGAAAGHSPVPD